MTTANECLKELNDDVTTALLTRPPFGVLSLTSKASHKPEQISSNRNQMSLGVPAHVANHPGHNP